MTPDLVAEYAKVAAAAGVMKLRVSGDGVELEMFPPEPPVVSEATGEMADVERAQLARKKMEEHVKNEVADMLGVRPEDVVIPG